MVLLVIALLSSFALQAGHPIMMDEDTQSDTQTFEDIAQLVHSFNHVSRGGEGQDELRKLAGNISLETLEVMSKACEYAVRERQKVLLNSDDRETQSLLELRALAWDLQSRHYNGQLVAQQDQRKRIKNTLSIGMSIASMSAAFTTAVSYICCNEINVLGSGMVGAGCGCLCGASAISDFICGEHIPTQTERDLVRDLEKARELVAIKQKAQNAADAQLKKQWQERKEAKKLE